MRGDFRGQFLVLSLRKNMSLGPQVSAAGGDQTDLIQRSPPHAAPLLPVRGTHRARDGLAGTWERMIIALIVVFCSLVNSAGPKNWNLVAPAGFGLKCCSHRRHCPKAAEATTYGITFRKMLRLFQSIRLQECWRCALNCFLAWPIFSRIAGSGLNPPFGMGVGLSNSLTSNRQTLSPC